jgi:hypothetical protein
MSTTSPKEMLEEDLNRTSKKGKTSQMLSKQKTSKVEKLTFETSLQARICPHLQQ